MTSITCPRCGSPVPLRRFFTAANKPFCTRCGWNLDRAEAALAGKNTLVKFLPLGIAGIALFAFFASSRAHAPFFVMIPAFFSLFLLVPLWSYYSLRKEVAAAKMTANPGLASAQPPLDPSLQMLQSLPRPRRVRLRLKGTITAVAFVLFTFVGINAVVLLGIGRRDSSPGKDGFVVLLPFLFMILVFVAAFAVPLVRDKRNVPLLRDGELAFGRVISQQTVQQGKASYSRIDYEFQTNAGQQVRNSVRDFTSAVFEDMTVPVFYDPLDPSKNTTPCTTYFTVVSSTY